jgi:hypothetical protein
MEPDIRTITSQEWTFIGEIGLVLIGVCAVFIAVQIIMEKWRRK